MIAPEPKNFHAIAFGLLWASDLALPAFHPATALRPAEIEVNLRHEPAPARSLPQDGRRVRFLPGGFSYHSVDLVDIYARAPGSLDLYPGAAWNGVPPPALYSTATALLLAFRGLVPMHGSAVEQDGEATLICGPAGSGKSTGAARLIAGGGRLISDDLSILHPHPHAGPPSLYAGRGSIRLYQGVFQSLAAEIVWRQPAQRSENKVAVFPPLVDPFTPIPLRKVVILGSPPGALPLKEYAGVLGAQLFRPAQLRRAPGHALRLAMLAFAARHLELTGAPCL